MSRADDIVRKVKALEIKVKSRVNNFMSGEYQSAVKGQGMTFSEFREYVPGDDVRSLAWKMYARTGRMHIKEYEEEREFPVFFLVDGSESMYYGYKDLSKIEVALEVLALIGFSAVKNNDLCGVGIYSKSLDKQVPFKKGMTHVRRLLSEIISHKAYSKEAALDVAIRSLLPTLKKRTHLIVLSDFQNVQKTNLVKALAQKNDVHMIHIKDSFEESLPQVGWMSWSNSFGKNESWANLKNPGLRRLLNIEILKNKEKKQDFLKSSGVRSMDLMTSDDIFKKMHQYYRGLRR